VSDDLHASLTALGNDVADLFLLHYDHPTTRVQPVLEQLNRHIDEGKITAMGASNWSHERISDANAVAASHGWKPFCASSVQFSLADWTRSLWPGAVTLGGEDQREHHVTVAQVALAYVLRQPHQVFAMVGCTNPREVREQRWRTVAEAG
jgi:aryl-alcohol dehydrogenase-like predicted oxidoreductase